MKSRLLAVALLLLPSVCLADEIPFRGATVLDTDNFHGISFGHEADFFSSGLAFGATDNGALTLNANDSGRIFVRHMGGPLRRHLLVTSDGDSDSDDSNSKLAAVPEPGTLVLFGTGLSVLGGALRRKLRHG